ncbi:MAG: MaoC family dehydratase [Chloroflexi bacterium]|nr:MaoC family dehydratase [Chloroflexota bacterium]
MAWTEGQELPCLHKYVSLEQIAQYAHASGDLNPIHLDEAFAAQSSFGRVVAHGMLGLAFVSEMLAQAFGRAWLESGRLRVRFRAPAYPGDDLLTYGSVTKVTTENSNRLVTCIVGLRKADGQEVLTGESLVILESDQFRANASPAF